MALARTLTFTIMNKLIGLTEMKMKIMNKFNKFIKLTGVTETKMKILNRFEIKFLDKTLKSLDRNSRILDVGCGYGNKLKYIHEQKYNIEGVEKNQEIVTSLSETYKVFTPEQFKKQNKKYDLIIFSHIIEHLNHEELLEFLNYYLSYLKAGGYVLIFTPLMHSGFYFDFDHVKPYYPESIHMMFCRKSPQVQYERSYDLEMIDLCFRKSPLSMQKSRSELLGYRDPVGLIIKIILGGLYVFSGKLFSKRTGWAGLFIKKNKVMTDLS